MAKISTQELSPVARTALLPLCIRAAETRRADALLRDPKAAEVACKLDCDCTQLLTQTHDMVSVLLRMREFDRRTRAFLAAHPAAIVVDIGCGLDTRFYRVDNGSVEWYNLDLPEMITLRRQVIGESERCHLIGCSVLDLGWIALLKSDPQQDLLFLAEGVLMFLEGTQVMRLVRTLADRFPGAEFVFDTFTPFFAWLSPLIHPQLRQTPSLIRWGLTHDHDPETWRHGIKLMSTWYYFNQPEPRLGMLRLLQWVPGIAGGAKIVQYQLGNDRNSYSSIPVASEQRMARSS